MVSEASGVLSSRQKGILLLLAAAGLWSSAGIFTRAVNVDIWTMQFWRALSGAAFLLGVIVWQFGSGAPRALLDIGRAGLVVVPCSAISMVCYISALHLTTVAEVMIVYATQPFVNAAIAWIFLREPMGRRTMLAASMALVGIAITVFAGDFSAAANNRVLGDGLALLMVFGFSAVYVMARGKRPETMTAVNALAAGLSALICLPLAAPLAISWPDLGMMVAFGALTLGLGLTLLIAGIRHIPAGEAALVTLMDVPLSPLWVWLAFNERPGQSAIWGGLIVLAAVLWQMSGELRPRS